MDFLQDINPREYQQKIFETCAKKNCLVVLPTGLGKTLVALMLTIQRMKDFPGERVVFLAPTRPLAEQHMLYFKKHLPELFGDMQLFTGKVKAEDRKKIWQTADIIFSTPQCVGNDLKNQLYDLKEVCLLIEDEAHRCIKNYAYTYVAKQYQKQSKHPRILGLTASPGSEHSKIKEICRNLSVEEVELRVRDSDDVKSYLQELEFKKIIVPFPSEFEEMRQILKKIFYEYIEKLKKRKLLWEFPSKTNLIKLQKKLMTSLARGNKNFMYMHGVSECAQAIKIQHALELLETQTISMFNKYLKDLFKQAEEKKSKGVSKLVAKPEFNFVFMKSNELLIKNIEHPKIKELIEIVKQEKSENKNLKIMVFAQFRDTAKTVSEKLNQLKGIKAKIFVGQVKKEGTGLSQKEQKQILDEFSSGKINCIVSTSIGEEGLDIIETSHVIFYESVPSAIRVIQRRGRTARIKPGKLIMLITKNTRDETYYYVSRAKERKMHSAISEIKKELQEKDDKKLDKQKTLTK